MAIRHSTRYQIRQKRRDTSWLGRLDQLAEEARAKAAREERAKHPRKKQPRHVRIAQPLQPLNPHGK